MLAFSEMMSDPADCSVGFSVIVGDRESGMRKTKCKGLREGGGEIEICQHGD